MHRTLALVCAAAVALVSIASDAKGQTAELAELVLWPLMTAGVAVEELRLASTPAEEISGTQGIEASAGAGVEFGVLPVGNASDPGISFALIHSDPPELLADMDNDEDLSNDIPIAHREQISSRSYSWFFVVQAEYESAHGPILAETAVSVTALYSYETGGYTVGYSGFSQRRGQVVIDGEAIPIAISSARTDGTYEANQLFIAVDSDRDGHIDSLPGSHEAFLPGQGLQIGTVKYRVTSVTPWGDRMKLAPLAVVPPRPVIAVGKPAPDFEFTTIDGEASSLGNLAGRVVVLMFLPSLSDGGCFSCASSSSPYVSKLQSVHEVLRSLERVTILVVTSSEGLPGDLSALPRSEVLYTANPAIAEVYRRNHATIVISPDGIIAAQDDVWVNYNCERPRGMFDELSVHEITAVVQRLVSEMESL